MLQLPDCAPVWTYRFRCEAEGDEPEEMLWTFVCRCDTIVPGKSFQIMEV